MKRFIYICILFLLSLTAAAQADSARMAALGLKLSEYYEALKHESIDVQKNECDFLIGSTSDSLIRQFVTLDIYDHYMDSPVMGAENVAVHVYDKWIASGKIKMRTEADRVAARVFAEFNRQSLIGEKAPALVMESVDGVLVNLFDSLDTSRRYRVLYFYDTDCAKCKVETIYLKNLFANIDYPVDLYAIYVGDDRADWNRYVAGRLTVKQAVHLWDPMMDSDYQRKYGVLQTPRLFLVGPDGAILGRGLDVRTLEKMMDGIFAERNLEYGGPESVALYDGIFQGGDPTEAQVKGIADYISDRTLGRGDTLMFRQMAGDYLYYLASHAGEGYKEGLRYHLDKNILADNRVWRSADDSLKVIGFAQIMSDLLSKAVPGTVISPVKVSGELYYRWNRSRQKKIRLDKLKGRTNIIIFYTERCDVCAAQKAAALELMASDHDRKTYVLMVNVDHIIASDSALASRLMDAFDLSSLPFVIMTDSDGVILRRYVSL